MSAHDHFAGFGTSLRLQRWSRLLVIAVITAAAMAALLGVAANWPDQQRLHRLQGEFPYAAKGVIIVHARLTVVRVACTGTAASGISACGNSDATVLTGANRGRSVSIALTPDLIASGLRPGDQVLLFDSTAQSHTLRAATGGTTESDSAGTSDFAFYRADRGPNLIWLSVLFSLAIILVATRRGLMALLSLGFAGLVIIGFLIPALLTGRPAVPATIAAAVLILTVMLYATHGISMRTSVALVGALVGVVLTTLSAWFGVIGSRLAGIGDDAAATLTFNVHGVAVQQLVIASVVLAGIGTLNDVTVTQASALFELRAAAPAASSWDLFRRTIRIGRDHVASSVYTLAFAYLGTALVLFVAVQLSADSPGDLLTSEDIAEEIVRTLAGGIALVLAMPLTTAIGALVLVSAFPEPPTPAPSQKREHRAAPQYRRTVRRTVDDWSPHVTDELRKLPDNPWHARSHDMLD